MSLSCVIISPISLFEIRSLLCSCRIVGLVVGIFLHEVMSGWLAMAWAICPSCVRALVPRADLKVGDGRRGFFYMGFDVRVYLCSMCGLFVEKRDV